MKRVCDVEGTTGDMMSGTALVTSQLGLGVGVGVGVGVGLGLWLWLGVGVGG